MIKKAITLGIVFCSSIHLVGCNTNEVVESEQEVVVSQEKLFSELQNEIIASVTEQTELESDSLAIMLDGGAGEFTISVGTPKDAKIDDILMQEIVEDSLKNISEPEGTSEEKTKVKIKIEKY